MFAISLPPTHHHWSTLSFPSTLYLCPVLDLLLAKVPEAWQDEIRLGLQEALVNAAKHGNNLDPSKMVLVEFTVTDEYYSWVISDEGTGFIPQCSLTNQDLPPEEAECGRGLCLLYEIFDQVSWNRTGTQLRLAKRVTKTHRNPLFS